jgi:hypothetical protein
MELKIKISTNDEMLRFVKFFSKSSLEFTPANKEEFTEILYDTIRSGSLTPSYLKSSVFEEYLTAIDLKYSSGTQVKNFINGVKEVFNDSITPVLLKPTEHFRMICGSEALSCDGMMSKKNAFDYIMYQISIRNVKVSNGTIYMDDYLNTLFNTSLTKVRKDELLDFIDTLFLEPGSA